MLSRTFLWLDLWDLCKSVLGFCPHVQNVLVVINHGIYAWSLFFPVGYEAKLGKSLRLTLLKLMVLEECPEFHHPSLRPLLAESLLPLVSGVDLGQHIHKLVRLSLSMGVFWVPLNLAN